MFLYMEFFVLLFFGCLWVLLRFLKFFWFFKFLEFFSFFFNFLIFSYFSNFLKWYWEPFWSWWDQIFSRENVFGEKIVLQQIWHIRCRKYDFKDKKCLKRIFIENFNSPLKKKKLFRMKKKQTFFRQPRLHPQKSIFQIKKWKYNFKLTSINNFVQIIEKHHQIGCILNEHCVKCQR